MRILLIWFGTIILFDHAGSGAERVGNNALALTNAVATPMPLPSSQLHNLFRAAPNVFSGSAPEDDAAFAEIARLGVKMVITVDGTKPDLERAHNHGLRYVHLPFGYDGVPRARMAELAKAVQTADGPVYVHCHHGMHRGPAAVAVICEATAGWTTNQAVAWLHQAGTSSDYPGLYRAAAEFHPLEASALANVGELPERTPTTSFVDTMVAIDNELEFLRASQKTGWSGIPAHPDLTPAHAAVQLWEHLRELSRTEEVARRPDGFSGKLADAEKAADKFRLMLRQPSGDRVGRDAAFKSLGNTCGACHQQYRNCRN